MSRSSDPSTRSTRDAANASAVVVILFGALWFVTTQVRAIRDVSPFGEDPFDAVATYAVILLPFVAGATWIRSLRHRGAALPTQTVARIRWGSTIAALTVLAAAVADLAAIVATGWPAQAGSVAAFVTGIVMTLVVASLAALALLVRAEMRAARASVDPFEPDVIDDGLALAVDVAAHVRLDRPVRKLAAAIERFLDGSGWSPRRHRIGFGIVLAVACGLAFSFWHVVREGPPPDLVAPVIFTILGGAGVLAGYLGSLIPLRLLRPSDTIRPTRRSSDAARTGRTLG